MFYMGFIILLFYAMCACLLTELQPWGSHVVHGFHNIIVLCYVCMSIDRVTAMGFHRAGLTGITFAWANHTRHQPALTCSQGNTHLRLMTIGGRDVTSITEVT